MLMTVRYMPRDYQIIENSLGIIWSEYYSLADSESLSYHLKCPNSDLVSLEMADISFPKEFLFLASFLRSFFISDFFPDGVPLINCISSSESNHKSILICFISSSVQKAVEKLKVAMHHRPPALRATW